MKTKLLLCLMAFVMFACKNNRSNYDSESDSESYTEETEAYPDGTYCADVEYYNSNTGTRNTYSLNVEVESNEVTVIHWPNGGWLDDDHFYPEELDSDGACSFTSDKEYEYSIQITGSECSYTDQSRMQSDVNDDYAAITCPECGGNKYEYDDLCDNCVRKKKDIAEHTCQRCGQVDNFMWSGDELCSDCKRDDEE